jgi:hypothetical protein
VKNVSIVILAVSVSLLPACDKTLSRESDSSEAPIVFSNEQKELITDRESGFCIMDNLTLWGMSSGTPKFLTGIPIGDKLALLGQNARIVQGGAPRELVRVRLSSDVEGWVRTEYVIADSVLAVTVDDEVAVYSRPIAQAFSEKSLPRMTLLAIYKSSAAMNFIRVSCIEQAGGTLTRGIYLKNSGVSSLIDDVKSAILFKIASRTENQRKRAAFLTSALSDYPRSKFAEEIRQSLAITREPASVEIPTESLTATFVTADDSVNVLSIPDEAAGAIVATIPKGRTVEVMEKTRQSYSIGALSAPWYRIKDPEGWVFGVSLVGFP